MFAKLESLLMCVIGKSMLSWVHSESYHIQFHIILWQCSSSVHSAFSYKIDLSHKFYMVIEDRCFVGH